MFNILCIFTMKQKIYYYKTIFQFDLYMKQKNYLWNSDFIMTLNSRLHNDEVLSRSMKIYYKARHKKISSTLFFFLQFTKINYQQSDKWSFYLLPFLLFEEYICYSWRRQNTEDNAWPTSRKEFQNVCL